MGESIDNISPESGNTISEDLVNIHKELIEIIVAQGEFTTDDKNRHVFRIFLDNYSILFKGFSDKGWGSIALEYQDDSFASDADQSLPILTSNFKAIFSREERVSEYSSVEYKKSFYFEKDIDATELYSRVETVNGLVESEYMRLNLSDIESSFIKEQMLAEEYHYYNEYQQSKAIHREDLDLLKNLIELFY